MAKLAHSSFALDFLRRLLCAHSAPGGSSTGRDIALLRGDGDDAAAVAFREEGTSPARSPCIVARLMGLDAMPTPARDQQQTPLRRSRSASSAESLSPPPPTPCCSPRPRVARTTSASFRDRPTYLRRENDEFLLLSFTPDDDGDSDLSLSAGFSRGNEHGAEIAGSRRGRRRDGDGAKKERRRRRGLSRRRCGDEEAESGRGGATENSSPVSVLEARDAMEESSSTTTTTSSSSVEEVGQAEQCSPSSDGGEIRPAPTQEQGSRRKLLQPPFDDHGGRVPPEAASTGRVSDCSGRDRRAANNGEVIAPAASGVWRTICRLVEDDICGVKWGARDDAANIAAEVESEIFDQLIRDELMQLIVV